MSNRMTTSQLRREFILRRLRNNGYGGQYINLRGGWQMNDDIRRLIKDGHLVVKRTQGKGRTELSDTTTAYYRGNGFKRGSYIQLTDMSKMHKIKWINCPCCGAGAPQDIMLIHSNNCTIRDDHNRYKWNRSGWWHNENWKQK